MRFLSGVWRQDDHNLAGEAAGARHAAGLDPLLLSAARDRWLTSLAKDTAHDVRGLLNVITLHLELLARAAQTGIETADRKNSQRSADVIRRALQRLDRQMSIVLRAQMIESDSPREFDLSEMCGLLVDLIGPRASRQQVDVSCSTTGAVRLSGFPDQIQAAILSLMINALDAMPNGGRLRVAVGQAESRLVRVIDTGPGISSDLLRDIYRPGFTTNAGAGLGLHLARVVVERHGGVMRYEPAVGGGSCFVVQFPRDVHH